VITRRVVIVAAPRNEHSQGRKAVCLTSASHGPKLAPTLASPVLRIAALPVLLRADSLTPLQHPGATLALAQEHTQTGSYQAWSDGNTVAGCAIRLRRMTDGTEVAPSIPTTNACFTAQGRHTIALRTGRASSR